MRSCLRIGNENLGQSAVAEETDRCEIVQSVALESERLGRPTIRQTGAERAHRRRPWCSTDIVSEPALPALNSSRAIDRANCAARSLDDLTFALTGAALTAIY